jgi:REP element-mobilizing transposase RayT
MEARKHRIKLLAVCPMPDHIHLSIVASSRRQLSGFMRDTLRKYAAQFNAVSKLKGPVFRESFGSAPKSFSLMQSHHIPLPRNWSSERQGKPYKMP